MNDHSDAVNQIINIVKEQFNLASVDIHASFASLGVTSLRALQLVLAINAIAHTKLRVHDLFLYPTPHALANYLMTPLTPNKSSRIHHLNEAQHFHHEPIAIIAMDCKYPGADTCEEFWHNCMTNKESITFFNQGRSNAIDKEKNSYEVYARGILKDIEHFDAHFFNYSPKEAQLSDPQHRLFIEAAWKALEKAGYASEDKTHGKIGVYASMNDSTYMLDQYALQRTQGNLTNRFALQRLMSSQFLATKVAHLLNCTGPSLTVQTACSSSLVAVALACQQLASLECDMAIAGGVSIVTPQDQPYFYQKGNIYSPDGHCRPFDAKAQGTVFSNGLGVMVLKRLSQAIRDRDSIISVIKGYAMNNDGSHKMSYAAPSMQGQLDCILSAQAMANVETSSIQYVETHGTGTLIGDPIEIDALTKAFRITSSKEQFCALGSVKANIGHTHVAAGIAGLIKASLALKNQQIPPALHFTTPHPDIDLKRSPFYINTRLLHWQKKQFPRRAAVSAFGVGGTNAHIILEEPAESLAYPAKGNAYSILLSAKSEQALQDYRCKLIDFLENANDNLSLADVAYTFQVGRNHYPYRFGLACENVHDALTQLKNQSDLAASTKVTDQKKLVFLFPGQGTQYINMSRELYAAEPIYKEVLDQCLTLASQYTGVELFDILFPTEKNQLLAEARLFDTQLTQPILFAIEYALVQLLRAWGIEPDIMLGHSLGEYVSACLAGVFSLNDAIHLVCARGNAIALCEKGEMWAVFLSKDKIQPFCTEEAQIAVENSPNSCVISGSHAGIQAMKEGIAHAFQPQPTMKQLSSHYPFHTHLLKAAVKPFLKILQSVERKTPRIPYLSNATGDWITEADVLNDQYWIDHMLTTVQFSQCIKKLLDHADEMVFVEVGPGKTLLASVQMHEQHALKLINVLPSKTKVSKKTIVNALKDLWCYGYVVNWRQFYAHEKRQRIPLPTYPFQKKPFWIDQIDVVPQKKAHDVSIEPDLAFYSPTWACDPKTIGLPVAFSMPQTKWIIFANQSGLCQETCQQLIDRKANVVKVFQEEDKVASQAKDYILNPRDKTQYDQVIKKLVSDKITHYAIIHFWGAVPSPELDQGTLLDVKELYQGLYSGIFIAQAFSRILPDAMISWAMVTTDVHAVLGNEPTNALKSTVLSLCKVLPLENPKLNMQHIDIDTAVNTALITSYANEIINQVSKDFSQLASNPETQIIALRGEKCWTPSYHPINPIAQDIQMTDHSVYLITGGLGGMGLTFAQWLCSQNANVTLVLVSRSEFPEQASWDHWIISHVPENSISKKIRILQKIVSQGCCIKILQADIADFQRMEKVIPLIETQFGAIRGIFHLAGVAGKGLATLKEISEIQRVLRPKVQGTHVLIQLFHDKKLDFFVAASSLTAIAGGVGQIDYCAANIFLDHVLKQRPFKYCKRLLTINWNAWRSVGMAIDAGHATHCRLYAGNSVTPEQGSLVLNQCLSASYDQVIVSRYHPDKEIQRIKKTFQCLQPKKDQRIDKESKELSVAHILAQAWRQVLGVVEVDKQTNFYDCGGDSLTLIQLIAVLENHLDVKITLQDLLEHTTFGTMAIFIEDKMKRSSSAVSTTVNTMGVIV